MWWCRVMLGGQSEIRVGKLNLVDLAGSERYVHTPDTDCAIHQAHGASSEVCLRRPPHST